jgi:chromosome segregation ATPase
MNVVEIVTALGAALGGASGIERGYNIWRAARLERAALEKRPLSDREKSKLREPEKLRLEVIELRIEVAALRKEVQDWARKEATATAERDAYMRDVAERDAQIKRVESDLADTELRATGAERQVEEMRRTITLLISERDDLKRERDEARSRRADQTGRHRPQR